MGFNDKPAVCAKEGCGNKTFETKMYYWVCKKCRHAIAR